MLPHKSLQLKLSTEGDCDCPQHVTAADLHHSRHQLQQVLFASQQLTGGN